MCTTSPEKVDINVIVSLFKQTLKFSKTEIFKNIWQNLWSQEGTDKKELFKTKSVFIIL